MEVSDQEIIAQFLVEETQERAFGLLVDKYSERLYFQIRRIVNNHTDTDDVLQNTLVKVWKHLAKFRADSQLHTWLYRIAYNESMTFIKQQQKHISADLATAPEPSSSGNAPTSEDIQAKLKAAIHELPEKQKQVFNMRYYDELSYEQISEILGTSVGGLKASYHHAVKKIESFLTNN